MQVLRHCEREQRIVFTVHDDVPASKYLHAGVPDPVYVAYEDLLAGAKAAVE